MPNKNNKDLKEFESQIDDHQLLIIAQKTYEHVKIIKEQEEK